MTPLKRFLVLLISILIVFVLNVRTTRADTVVLKNGDKLTGTITGGGKGTLILSTDYSSPITIQTSTIQSLVMSEPIKVRLKNGKTLQGQLSIAEGGKPAITTGQGASPSTINWSNIESFNPPPSSWTGDVTFGANSQAGNAHILSASIGASARWTSPANNVGVRFLYNYAEESGIMSARNVYGSAKYEHIFVQNCYGYLNGEILSDKFRDLRLRTAEGPGIGYQLWNIPSSTLSVEAGYSYFTEDHYVGQDGSWSTVRAAATLLWHLQKMLSCSE